MAELLTREIAEEYRKRATERDTFPTFERVEKGVYRFCGNCFAGEIKHIE